MKPGVKAGVSGADALLHFDDGGRRPRRPLVVTAQADQGVRRGPPWGPPHHLSLMTRRDLGALAAAAIAVPRRSMAQSAANPPEPVLEIAEWSYHFYGVEHALLARGTVCNGMQMYVEHWIPAEVRHPYPVVLIHGGYGQGSDWFTTPDGRRGWATLFLEQGYKVYVLDRPGQGRNPFQPFMHGNFDAQAPTFERARAQWPGGDDRSAVAQVVASMGQPMAANNAQTQNVWRTRGAKLLDDIGPAILVTHGDGAVFASVVAQSVAQDRPQLVKGIVAVQPSATSLEPASVPIAIVSASDPGIAGIEHIRLAERGVHGGREALAPVLAWLNSAVGSSADNGAPAAVVNDPHPNRESTALKLADQGGFWVGIGRKQMPYGTIAQGQMCVQYMIPAERRHPYPVVMIARRRRTGHAHDGHRRAARLGALFRASRLRRVLARPAQLRPVALSSRRAWARAICPTFRPSRG